MAHLAQARKALRLLQIYHRGPACHRHNRFWCVPCCRTVKYGTLLSLILPSPSPLGPLTLLDVTSSIAKQEIYPENAGLGIGMLFHAPFTARMACRAKIDRAR
ncbi:hypothetical protein JB92DRAFT_1130435 [Gautieria morchelliformis]|nr:hypothetical protein JB92DRAFT_1130435 [Gautieria morchelliformis]